MLRVISLVCLLAFAVPRPAWSQGFSRRREMLKDRVAEAFSPNGRWQITKMDVTMKWVRPAGAARVSVEVRSTLGGPAYLDVQGGTVGGKGTATYIIDVAAGDVPVALPWGLQSALRGNLSGIEDREFSVSGTLDPSSRDVALKAFEADGGPLKPALTVFAPIPKEVEFAIWPAMTNVETKYYVSGGSLVMAASGTVGDFICEFEAIKPVNLEDIFELLIDELLVEETNGGRGTPRADGSDGRSRSNGSNGENGANGDDARDAESIQIRSGSTTVSPGELKLVRFAQPLPSNQYAVSLTPVDLAGNNVTPVVSRKSGDGFAITLRFSSGQTVAKDLQVDWVAVPFR